MPFQEVHGVQLYYEEDGQGAPVLLLHSAFNTGRSQFGKMLERLAERGYRAILPDRRGYGRSRPPQRDYPPDFYRRDMEDMAALLAALPATPAHIVGIGDGGIVAMLLALAHPDAVRSLVVWAANVAWPLEERGLYVQLVDAANSLDFSEAMRERHGMTRAESRTMLEDYVAASLAITDGAWEPGLAGRLGAIRCPVLIGAGAREDFLPLHHARTQAAAIPQAELWIEPHVSHFWPMTEEGSEVFIGRVLNWLVSHQT